MTQTRRLRRRLPQPARQHGRAVVGDVADRLAGQVVGHLQPRRARIQGQLAQHAQLTQAKPGREGTHRWPESVDRRGEVSGPQVAHRRDPEQPRHQRPHERRRLEHHQVRPPVPGKSHHVVREHVSDLLCGVFHPLVPAPIGDRIGTGPLGPPHAPLLAAAFRAKQGEHVDVPPHGQRGQARSGDRRGIRGMTRHQHVVTGSAQRPAQRDERRVMPPARPGGEQNPHPTLLAGWP